MKWLVGDQEYWMYVIAYFTTLFNLRNCLFYVIAYFTSLLILRHCLFYVIAYFTSLLILRLWSIYVTISCQLTYPLASCLLLMTFTTLWLLSICHIDIILIKYLHINLLFYYLWFNDWWTQIRQKNAFRIYVLNTKSWIRKNNAWKREWITIGR